MHYMKGRISFRSSLSLFCALLPLASIAALCQYNIDIPLSSPSSLVSKIVQAAAAISPSS
jgi:hypothetical protein